MFQKRLEAFHYVATKGSFTAAARALNVGQPTISTHVKAIETHFGVELFLRRGRGVELTPVGRLLLTITRGLLGHQEEAVAFLKTARALKAGKLSVGATGPFDVMELLEAFRTRYPAIELSVSLGTTAEVLNGLIAFGLDLGILGHPPDDLRLFSLRYNRHPVQIMVHAGHRLAKRRSIRLKELEGENMVLRGRDSTTRQAFEAALARAEVNIRPVMEINSREAVREAILRRFGIGIVSASEFVPDPRLRALSVVDAEMFIDIYLVCLAERRARPLIAAFVELSTARARGPDA
ncbi:MAG: LysR family transcriptional regulator [Rhodospirillales bacterium]|nr:LysR family transcriptional regulator [Rhodospirillales bacterium]